MPSKNDPRRYGPGGVVRRTDIHQVGFSLERTQVREKVVLFFIWLQDRVGRGRDSLLMRHSWNMSDDLVSPRRLKLSTRRAGHVSNAVILLPIRIQCERFSRNDATVHVRRIDRVLHSYVHLLTEQKLKAAPFFG